MTRLRHFITTRFWFWYACVLTATSVHCARGFFASDDSVATITPTHAPVNALSVNPFDRQRP